MDEARDRKETLRLAEMYLPLRRCVGGHLIHQSYVCPWCDSYEPSGRAGYCLKERKAGPDAPPERITWKQKP